MKDTLSVSSHTLIANRNRRCWFSASASRPEGQSDWNVRIVADYVPTEEFRTTDPLQLIHDEMKKWTDFVSLNVAMA